MFTPGMIALVHKELFSGSITRGISKKSWVTIGREYVEPWIVIVRSQVLFNHPAYRVVAGTKDTFHSVMSKDAYVSWVVDEKFLTVAGDSVWENRFFEIERAERALSIYNRVKRKEQSYDFRRATGQLGSSRNSRNKNRKRACRHHDCKTPCRKIPKPEMGIPPLGADEDPA